MFMSHDLIFNLGHTISDFWIVFVTGLALELDLERYQLVNMDALRGNGPAGRGTKLTLAGKPDHLSPFFETYDKWFGRGVRKAIDYQKKRVCFKEAVFQAKPGPAHIWSALAAEETASARCARQGPSWLFSEYNRFTRERWGLRGKGREEGRREGGGEAQGRGSDAGGAFRDGGRGARASVSVTLIVRRGEGGSRGFHNEKEVPTWKNKESNLPPI